MTNLETLLQNLEEAINNLEPTAHKHLEFGLRCSAMTPKLIEIIRVQKEALEEVIKKHEYKLKDDNLFIPHDPYFYSLARSALAKVEEIAKGDNK